MSHDKPKAKYFTVNEANSLLPVINEIFDELDDRKRSLLRIYEQVQILEVMWGDGIASITNPDHNGYSEHISSAKDLSENLNEFVSKEILGRGLRFPPGGLDQGLIDFPTTLEDRWIFMCWERGETQVNFWHEITAGYAGRQNIQAEHIITMGKNQTIEGTEFDF
tara:strand:+ start:518 stop:1012 length:495 start_codon:yes stop_codon:yes gene_type:complete